MVYGSRRTMESPTTTGTTWFHNITTQGEMNSSGGVGLGAGVGVAGSPTLAAAQQGQGVAALLVMLAVLCFIFAYCCWGADLGSRSPCRRHCCCRLEDPEPDSRYGNSEQGVGSDAVPVTTPTVILLPHGFMLLVDGMIFTQYQTDPTGLDLVELGDSVLRAQQNPRAITRHQLQNSQGSILEMDAETPSKDSLGSVACFPPPTYESIYGKEESDMPPSYSDILLHRLANYPHEMLDMHGYSHDGKEDIEMQSLESCPHIVSNPLNGIPYHYATVTSFSSQSLPRRTVCRNPSIISNPLDSYYADNELGLYRLSQDMIPRVSSNANFGSYRIARDETHFRIVDENENRTQGDSIAENGNGCTQQPNNVFRNNERRNEVSRSIASSNEIMNSRNRARSNSRLSQDSRNSVENTQNHEASVVYGRVSEDVDRGNLEVPRDHRNTITTDTDRIRGETYFSEVEGGNGTNSDVRYFVRSRRTTADGISRTESLEVEPNYPDDEASNFGALADIRESRV